MGLMSGRRRRAAIATQLSPKQLANAEKKKSGRPKGAKNKPKVEEPVKEESNGSDGSGEA